MVSGMSENQEFFYHIVFPTYKRLPLFLNEEYKQFVVNIIDSIIASKDVDILVFKILTDHIHILIKKHVDQSLPSLVKTIKGRTTYYFYKQYPEFKIDLGRGRLWAKGYHTTIIENDGQLQNTIAYIKNNFDVYKGCKEAPASPYV